RLAILAAPELRSAKAVRPIADALGAELGWSRRQRSREADAWLEVAATEGVDPAAASRVAG
ncbi:MAG TPA: hypothetical protein VFR75_03750, partial [Solirubrobacterales bacterium]|nr:hypothetical protein [Solirubrobacterales bacterium]